nr:protein smg7 [Quercus suber]
MEDNMEVLLEQERVAEQQVAALLKDRSRPIADMLNAMTRYRKEAELCIFADFEHAEKLEDRLWLKHTEGRKYFHRALSNLRRADNQKDLVVAKRQCVKLFLYFLKDSHRFYQRFIHTLRATYPQVSELDLVANRLKFDDAGESLQPSISLQLRSRILNSCHRVLIYIGDLSRYRAAEKLDECPTYARAIGYYDLACSFRPSSGHGHHQQAVIFLEQRKHLAAVYELYRATVVDEPHPLAISNLGIEFDKIKEAKKKGELLKPGHPKDPDTHKNALIGWFVYLHAECFEGEVFAEFEDRILNSCHRVLICIGDLSRYRAAEKLDECPTYARAIGYYDLACSFRPSSGHGHHQQAVIFLEQRKHLAAVYELYRATVVDEPHPLAISNLGIEFDKIKEAKKKGELLKPGHPKDPDTHKNALIGWFVYLHAECFEGEVFAEFEAIEREFTSQLAKLLTHDNHDQCRLLNRVVMVNMASQFTASERFKVLLRVFQDSMAQNSTMDVDNARLASKLNPMAYRLLPVLHLYSAWLLPMVVLIDGLAHDDFVKPAVDDFWPTYTHTMDMISQTFPIWEFDDEPTVIYLLEEEAESLAFKPLVDQKTMGVWFDKCTSVQKPYCYDVERLSVEAEMLARVQRLLNFSVALAQDDDAAPIKLHGTRFLYGNEKLPEAVSTPMDVEKQPRSIDGRAQQPIMKPKPLTYAAAASALPAAVSHANARLGSESAKDSTKALDRTQDESLTRMVDNLLDGHDNHPVTPPQQHVSYPAVADDAQHNSYRDSAQEIIPLASNPYKSKAFSRPMSLSSPPGIRTPKSPGNPDRSSERLNSVSNVWAHSPLLTASPQFPSGLPTGTLSPVAQIRSRGHTRVNSANSIRSSTSPNASDPWSSLDSSRQLPGLPTIGQNYTNFKSNLGTPVLFGAGAGPWSSWSPGMQPTRENSIDMTPPNGQGG